jgi:hypothetical protein
MQHEMRKNFRTAKGIRGFHAKHVTIHGIIIMHRINWSKWAGRNTALSSTHPLKNDDGFIFLSISQLFSRNFYEELLNIGFLVILFLISIKFT